ncbi:BIRC1 protein, partial [Polypterus senegalus]|nr:BIRC1 protein [Polypterus senegalus]
MCNQADQGRENLTGTINLENRSLEFHFGWNVSSVDLLIWEVRTCPLYRSAVCDFLPKKFVSFDLTRTERSALTFDCKSSSCSLPEDREGGHDTGKTEEFTFWGHVLFFYSGDRNSLADFPFMHLNLLMAESELSDAVDQFKVNKIAEQLAQKYDRIKRIGLWLNQGLCFVKEEQEKFKEAQARLHQGYNPEMRSEISRLKSFETLKSFSSCSPSEMAKEGFYSTEVGSYMQCFCCGFVLLGTPQDKTPHICHQEFQPNCDFIKGLEVGNIPKYEVRVQQNIDIDLDKVQLYSVEEKRVESYKDWPNYSKADLIGLARAGFYFTVTGPENEWLHDSKRLCSSLRDVYNSSAFRNMARFSDCATVSIDLKHIFAWVPMVMKNINNQPMQKVSLPILLKNLSYITMIEGAAGSGKSALLRKIAILWASGHCSVLKRFKLVFYLSFNGLQKGQNLSDMIAEQLGMAQLRPSEELIRESIRKLNNQVLFLLDDCGVTILIPHCIEDLMLQNHINKASMVIGIQTYGSARVRQYASRILEMAPFPFYSTFYILRKVFSHNIALVERFVVELGLSLLLQEILKTPLMAIIICDLWIQHPNPCIETRNIFKAYLHHCVQKYPSETEKLAKLASCLGELALEGVFSNRTEFDRTYLEQAGIGENEALCTGLLDKCTAQRLRPMYKFFHFHFQEFVAELSLKQLSITALNELDIVGKLPDGFSNLLFMEDLKMKNVNIRDDCIRYASFIQHFTKLKCFHLKCRGSLNFSPIVESLASCEDMENLCIEGWAFYPDDVSALASTLPNFKKLKFLDFTGTHIDKSVKKTAAEKLVEVVGSLVYLEVLKFPQGAGMKSVSLSAIPQLQKLPNLKVLSMQICLDDSSIYELAKIAKEGNLQALQQLNLNVNHDITDSGWRSFFLNLDKMPHLADLIVSRMYTHNLKPSASTMLAFVQCASRLPSLLTINMCGWLLDTEDVQLFETMKQEHPQAKCLSLNWKWLEPIVPIIKEDTF